ncbi:BamA/TamA family outer membrane protein [Saccharicrinis aurantiacus]|uniref:BamA/TamA family outer membrane protein n=1 Tax=Saccharicrinis aurantiacus TaxID=1849719 RepID=UPI00094F7E9E|nr:BamA/TamA family outer membrane protein [Saccharicrinis aurantiacus]
MKIIIITITFLLIGLSTFSQNVKSDNTEENKVELDENGRRVFDDEKERKGVKYNFVPMPSYDPSAKWGISLINMFNYYPSEGDLVSPPSSSALFMQMTTNKSYMLGLNNKLFLAEDKWRISAGGFYGSINQNMLLSSNPADPTIAPSITDVTANVAIANVMFEHQILSNWYLGVGYMYNGRKVFGQNEEADALLKANGFSEDFVHTHGIRYNTSYDTRDNINYPYTGILASISMDQMMGDESQNILMADYRQYFTLRDNVSNVLAVHASGRFVSEDASRNFWSSYGRAGRTVQRGYEQGQYMDMNLVNFEIEFRKETPWLNHRLGFVAAIGTGKVFGNDNHESGASISFTNAEWLHMANVGIRYRLLPYERLNLKFDYARGKSGGVFYFGITEAF